MKRVQPTVALAGTFSEYIRERCAENARDASRVERSEPQKTSPLQLDFFVADFVDVAVKGDRYTMEHPYFSIAKTPDRRVREYTTPDGRTIRIVPSRDGIATIWDKDILLFALSQLSEAYERQQPTSPWVHIRSYDLLHATRRGEGWESYRSLRAALRRLKQTIIETDTIKMSGLKSETRELESFSWIVDYRIKRTADANGRERVFEFAIHLPPWLYEAVLDRNILTVHPDYFALKGGLERRLYEIARKHVGQQSEFKIGVDKLHQKTGSQSPANRFRYELRQVASKNPLPEYRVIFPPGRTSKVVRFVPQREDRRSGTSAAKT
jgi:plasmid replication initiation protein